MATKSAAKVVELKKPEISEKSRRFGKQVWAYRDQQNITLKEIAEFGNLKANELHAVETGDAEIDQCKVDNILRAFPGIAGVEVKLD